MLFRMYLSFTIGKLIWSKFSSPVLGLESVILKKVIMKVMRLLHPRLLFVKIENFVNLF